MGVEVDKPERAVLGCHGTGVGRGDRVVAADDQRHQVGVDDLAHRPLDRGMADLRLGGNHGRVAEVEDPQNIERVDAGLEMRAGRAARGADRARREPRSGAVGDELVHRGADDCDVEPGELGRVLRAGDAPECERSRVVRLLAVLAPPLHGVEHRR